MERSNKWVTRSNFDLIEIDEILTGDYVVQIEPIGTCVRSDGGAQFRR